MVFKICDIRNEDKTNSLEILTDFLIKNEEHLVMIIGHGNLEGDQFNKLVIDDFHHNEIITIFWLYSCNNAKNLAPELSKRGHITIGFSREVLILSSTMPYELDAIQESVANIEKENYDTIDKILLNAYYLSAKQALLQRDLIQVAILNHKKLSLRVFYIYT